MMKSIYLGHLDYDTKHKHNKSSIGKYGKSVLRFALEFMP